MAVAMEWVAKITTVAFEFFIPGVVGQWLDQRLGTKFLALAGFVLGLTVGLWHLLQMTRIKTKGPSKAERDEQDKP
jgi:hypothetical protein